MQDDVFRRLNQQRDDEQAARRSLVGGDEVCVTGRGTAAMAHRHNIVQRVTKTLVVTKNGDMVERFGIEDGHSKPYEQYGGTELRLVCRQGRPLRKG